MLSKVAIGVCTYNRPEMLTICLESLKAQIVPRGHELVILICDNESIPRNKIIVEQARHNGKIELRYIHEPRKGISYARNAILDAAEGFQFVGFTDDDCQPSHNWLVSMLDAMKYYGADVIYGHHEWIAPTPKPFWFEPMQIRYKEGQRLKQAACGNVLMIGAVARSLRFDISKKHGEDTDYFRRATAKGARIVYSERPVIFEHVPACRATLWYQLKRGFYHAASRSYLDRTHKGMGTCIAKMLSRLIWQVPLSLLRLIGAAIILPFNVELFRRWTLRSLGKLIRFTGCIAGAIGYLGDPYK